MAPIPIPTTMAMAISVMASTKWPPFRADFGCCERDEQEHERRRDAVVEPALDVEDAPYTGRDCRVRDDRESKSGVRWGQDRPDEQRRRQRKLREDQRGNKSSRGDRQEEPDPEKATDQAGVAPETGDVDRRGIREQHECERDFGQMSDRRRLDIDRQHIQHDRPKHEPHRNERERWTDRQFVETVGDERIARQEQGESRDPDFQVLPPDSAE